MPVMATGTWESAVLDQHACVHRHAIELQTEMQNRFLETRRRMLLTVAGLWPTSETESGFAVSLPESDSVLPQPATFTRQDLEIFSSGKISEVFGKRFAPQDNFPRQVRLPMPPLLMVDRVIGIDAEPGVLGPGTLWFEMDVHADA
jgi:hypothetical protein